jgi:dynein heavy chain 2
VLVPCFTAGDWLLLKNLHLVVAWLPLLEKEVHGLPGASMHPGFRLFLTTEAHPRFPPSLLEGALKVGCSS